MPITKLFLINCPVTL